MVAAQETIAAQAHAFLRALIGRPAHDRAVARDAVTASAIRTWCDAMGERNPVYLDRAAALVKPGGRIAYVTCSVLAEENGDQIRAFAGRHADFSVDKPANVTKALGERAYLFGRAVLISEEGLLMTPRRTDTDGFFVSMLRRSV